MSVQFRNITENAKQQRLDNYLLKILKGVPKSRIYRIIRKGEIRVNKGRKNADYKLQIGDIVRIPPIRISKNKNKYISDELKNLIKNNIIYEDKGLLIINKPAKLAVHSGSNVPIGAIDIIREIYHLDMELVHRLDRATSGCLLIAKKRSILKNLNQQIAANKINKNYLALVKNSWQKKQHTIDAPLTTNAYKVVIDDNGKKAISLFHPLKNFKTNNFEASLTNINIQTGRTHQIRVHSQYAQHPIAGDDKYGDKEFNKIMQKLGLKRLFLHAHNLSFFNPTTEKIQKIEAPLSIELVNFLESLK